MRLPRMYRTMQMLRQVQRTWLRLGVSSEAAGTASSESCQGSSGPSFGPGVPCASAGAWWPARMPSRRRRTHTSILYIVSLPPSQLISHVPFWPRLFGRCHRRSGGGQTPCRYAVNFVLPQFDPTGTNETSAEPLRCAPGLFASVDVQCAGRNGCGMPSRMYDPNRLSLRKLLQQRKSCRTNVPRRDLCFARFFGKSVCFGGAIGLVAPPSSPDEMPYPPGRRNLPTSHQRPHKPAWAAHSPHLRFRALLLLQRVIKPTRLCLQL